MPGVFVIVRDPRGSLVHVRTQDGSCMGCIEVGLFEVVKAIVLAEAKAPGGEGIPTGGVGKAIVTREVNRGR